MDLEEAFVDVTARVVVIGLLEALVTLAAVRTDGVDAVGMSRAAATPPAASANAATAENAPTFIPSLMTKPPFTRRRPVRRQRYVRERVRPLLPICPSPYRPGIAKTDEIGGGAYLS